MSTFFQRRSRWGLLALWLLLPCCANSCAGTAEQFAEARVVNWEFHAPPEQTWHELQDLLSAQGFHGFSGAVPRNQTAVAHAEEHHEVHVRFNGTDTSYTVEVLERFERPSPDAGARVYADERTNRHLLWRLVQRVEPAHAEEIRRASELQAQRSRAAWSACDQFWERTFENAARRAAEQSSRGASAPSSSGR